MWITAILPYSIRHLHRLQPSTIDVIPMERVSLSLSLSLSIYLSVSLALPVITQTLIVSDWSTPYCVNETGNPILPN